MKTIAYFSLILGLASCGNPSLSGVPQSTLYETVRLFVDSVGTTMTNAPAIGTELTNNSSRAYVDLTNFVSARGQFSSSLTSTLVTCRIEYSIDDGNNWNTLVSDFAASTVANAAAKSSFTTIPTQARREVLVRALIAGDGVLDPVIRFISLDLSGN